MLDCLQLDNRDDTASPEALAMAGVDYEIVHVPFIDRPWIWRLQKFFRRIWPFPMKNKVADYENQSQKRRTIRGKRRSKLKVASENQKIIKSNTNKGSNKANLFYKAGDYDIFFNAKVELL